MKQSEALREWARILDMCQDTAVDPDTCIRCSNGKLYSQIGSLRGSFLDEICTGAWEGNTYALAIVEGKPVFKGDNLYRGSEPVEIIAPHEVAGWVYVLGMTMGAARFHYHTSYQISDLSWNLPPPKVQTESQAKIKKTDEQHLAQILRHAADILDIGEGKITATQYIATARGRKQVKHIRCPGMPDMEFHWFD